MRRFTLVAVAALALGTATLAESYETEGPKNPPVNGLVLAEHQETDGPRIPPEQGIGAGISGASV